MKEMIYKPKREIEVLDRGIYKEHEYFVISLGTHPCAYVKLNSENPQIAENVSCHGGVTYNRDYLMLSNDEKLIGNFIGWDYAHLDDRWGDEFCGYEYTTGEMVAECKEVIDELVDVRATGKERGMSRPPMKALTQIKNYCEKTQCRRCAFGDSDSSPFDEWDYVGCKLQQNTPCDWETGEGEEE